MPSHTGGQRCCGAKCGILASFEAVSLRGASLVFICERKTPDRFTAEQLWAMGVQI